MGKDFGDHRGVFDGGDDRQGADAVGTVFNIDIEDPLEQPGRVAKGDEWGDSA